MSIYITDNKYWSTKGNFSSNTTGWTNINGLYYGLKGDFDNQVINESDAHDLIAVFEYFPPTWVGNSYHQQKLEMNNIGFLHSVLIKDIQEKELFVSITGRKNHLFTEQLDQVAYTAVEEDIVIPLSVYLNGADESLPDFEGILGGFWNTVYNTFTDILPQYVGGTWNVHYTEAQIYEFLDTEIWDTSLTSFYVSQLWRDDAAVYNSYNFLKNFI